MQRPGQPRHANAQGTVVECVTGFDRRARCSRCTASATARRWRRIRPIRPKGASDADCIVDHRHRLASGAGRPRDAPRRAPTLRRRSRARRAARRLRRVARADRRRPAPPRPLPAARDALARAGRPLLARVAVVSGRPVGVPARRARVDGLDYVGHLRARADRRRRGGASIRRVRAVRRRGRAGRRRGRGRAAGPAGRAQGRRSRSPCTGATQPERGDEAQRWAAEAAPRYGLDAPLRGRMAVELRPPVPVDKGTTVAELVARRCGRRVRG